MLRLVASGASSANTPRSAALDSSASIMLVMVANHHQVTSLLFDPTTGAVEGLKKDATIVICSTVAPAYILETARRLREVGRGDIRVVDAPVSGGAGRAAEGTLSIFVSSFSSSSSGEEGSSSSSGAFAPHVQSVLCCLSDSKKLYHIPGGLGGGSKAKLIHQIFAGVHIAMANEAMGLAAVAGLDTKKVYDEICSGDGASWMFGNRVPFMLSRGLGRYSAVDIIAKDVGIITSTAREHGFPLPMVGTAEQLYLSAITKGWGAEDDCVVVRLYLPDSTPGLVMERAGMAASDETQSSSGGGGESTMSVADIQDLMIGVHLATMSEAMAFCERLGIDADLMYDIVINAAGASKVYEKYFAEMKKAGWGLKGVRGINEIRQRLVSAVSSHSSFLFLVTRQKQALLTMSAMEHHSAGHRLEDFVSVETC